MYEIFNNLYNLVMNNGNFLSGLLPLLTTVFYGAIAYFSARLVISLSPI